MPLLGTQYKETKAALLNKIDSIRSYALLHLVQRSCTSFRQVL